MRRAETALLNWWTIGVLCSAVGWVMLWEAYGW